MRNPPDKTRYQKGPAENNNTFVREELLRVRLLAELSTLREKHEKLSSKLRETDECFPAPSGNSFVGNFGGTELNWQGGGASSQEAFLGQDDREAIEALFNESNDSFTREFNEGSGIVDRDEIPLKILASVKK
uniref:Uncharacterized protein n=1 Tax=Trypanosoma congolense (strain IL3000) TaxID=1068625 RepID=G0UK47_TRYCI|nr:conserved hypothetical protein [Trypanosoma congolense IL3000]